MTPAIHSKHAIITGAAGFLGRYVARALSRSGWQVTGIGHGRFTKTEQMDWGITAWHCSDINIASLTSIIAHEGEPQLIFHSAGSASVGRSWDAPLLDFERTVVTLAAVIESIRRLTPNALLIYPSSAAVYGNLYHDKIKEDRALMPMSPYGANKLIGERMLSDAHRLYGLRSIIIRFFSLYGAGLRKQLLWDISQKLLANPKILCLDGDGSETRDFLCVEDAARLVVHLSQQASDEPIIVNGGNGNGISVGQVANCIIKATGNDGNTQLQFSGLRRKGDPVNLVADVGRIQGMGFQPEFQIEAGVSRLIKWVLSERV